MEKIGNRLKVTKWHNFYFKNAILSFIFYEKGKKGSKNGMVRELK